MGRLGVALSCCALLCCLTVAAPASAAHHAGSASSASSTSSWAESSIQLITSRGVFPGAISSYDPSAPLTAGTLATLVGGLEGSAPPPAASPEKPVTLAQLDAALVRALGLGWAARRFERGARTAGLEPPARFGTEVVARLLGMRTDLPVSEDSLELQPQQTATRADAAFSAARVITLGQEAGGTGDASATSSLVAQADAGGGVAYVRRLAASFSLPTYDTWQQTVLRTAVSFVGYPYVWGGENEKTEHGFDCSGLVWRVFKLASYPGAPKLASVFQGRTAAQMAGEVPRRERISIDELQPGDVLFSGDGPHSKPSQVGHVTIYLGNGWLIHSSGQGVALGRLEWYTTTFAWARRPLAEAGLSTTPAPTAATITPATSGTIPVTTTVTTQYQPPSA